MIALRSTHNIPSIPNTEHPQRILALDPGLHSTGYVLLRDEQIITYGVWHLEADTLNIHDAAGMLIEYVAEFLPDELILESPSGVKSNKRDRKARNLHQLAWMVETLRDDAWNMQIPTFEYAPTTIRRVVVGNGWASKEETATVISLLYPDLGHYLRRIRKGSRRHVLHVFDALAAALCHRSLSGIASDEI